VNRLFLRILGMGLLWVAAGSGLQAQETERALAVLRPPARLFWWDRADLLLWTTNSESVVAQAPDAVPGFAWKEAIVSWNLPDRWAVRVEARPRIQGREGPWYVMGRWSSDLRLGSRTSVRGQKDAIAEVETDVLRMTGAADAISVRMVFPRGLAAVDGPVRLGVTFTGVEASQNPPPGDARAWGRLLALPIRSQADYPEGTQSWCSPTSLTMLLAGWGVRLGRDDLAQDVRRVALGVDDPGWPGTGNWSFNMAYAGQQPGLAACVARFAGLGDLERWIAAGIPVAASVSYAQLKGAEKPVAGDGHLVVVSGFTATGDVQVHDPGVRRERVVRVFPRADFERAWDHSSRTVYLVWAPGVALPPAVGKRWPDR